MRIVVALGGKALLRRGEPASLDTQGHNIVGAVAAIAPLRLAGHDIVVTHGNGPQAGILALQAASTPDAPYPLDVLDAGNEGMTGYLIEQALIDALPSHMLVATVLSQVRVDRRDPAFQRPAKPVGPVYGEGEARALAAERGWRVARDGQGWRRGVACPKPLVILELGAIRMLVDQGVTVICAAGGGIALIARQDGSLAGVGAIIDADFASALLARQLDADWLLMLTDVDAVYDGFGTAKAQAIAKATPAELQARQFAGDSMGPKVEAACEFASATGGRAGIGRLDALAAILAGKAGTVIAVARS